MTIADNSEESSSNFLWLYANPPGILWHFVKEAIVPSLRGFVYCVFSVTVLSGISCRGTSQSLAKQSVASSTNRSLEKAISADEEGDRSSSSIQPVSSEVVVGKEVDDNDHPTAASSTSWMANRTVDDLESPFPQSSTLSVDLLIQEVLVRNPSLAEMSAAWQAAVARYPQVTSLDDPTFAVTLGPDTYGNSTVNPAYRVSIDQKYPFPGKLRLRGEQASATAQSAANDYETTRLDLILSVRNAFYNYYLVHKAIEVNEEGLKLLEDFRANAQTRYESALAPEQDVRQAEVELGRQRETLLTLEQSRQIAVARINTLLNLSPDIPLPPPPSELASTENVHDAASLRSLALSMRPDLIALSNRIRSEQASVALAYKEFYPDFTPFFMYDRFMGNTTDSMPLSYMAGASMNLPVRKDRRCAAVNEAVAKLNQLRASYDKQINQVNFEVQQAYAEVTQGQKTVLLYEQTILPAAEANVESARSAYITGKIPFISLIEAQRDLIKMRDRYYEVVASYNIRLAALERAVGGPLDQQTTVPVSE